MIRRRRHADRPPLELFATTAAGLEPVLERELVQLGAREVAPAVRGVAFRGGLEIVYRANLWLRTAHRVLRQLAVFPARDRAELYDGVRAVRWDEQLGVDQTLAVDAVGSSTELRNTQYVAQVVKDAVADWFRDRVGRRPSVDRRNPDLQLNARISAGRCVLSVDTSGERLHRRGYRPGFGTPAPLKESLAAGVVLLSGFDGTGRVVDPMCGSGTILVEAALIARNVAPGLLGRKFAFTGHRDFDDRLWNNVRSEARALARELDGCPIHGSDVSQTAVRAARAAVVGAGVDDVVRIRRADLGELELEPGDRVITNPPYGDRLGELGDLAALYGRIGDTLKRHGRGASAHVLTGSKFLAGKIGLRTERRDTLWNGALECRLLHYELY